MTDMQITMIIQTATEDAEDFLAENPRDVWERATWPGAVTADESLLNAVGVTKAAEYLGVAEPYDRENVLTDEMHRALVLYSKTWRDRVLEEVGIK